MSDVVESIHIRNPMIVKTVLEILKEEGCEVGRNPTEVAGNMILSDALRRRADRDRQQSEQPAVA